MFNREISRFSRTNSISSSLYSVLYKKAIENPEIRKKKSDKPRNRQALQPAQNPRQINRHKISPARHHLLTNNLPQIPGQRHLRLLNPLQSLILSQPSLNLPHLLLYILNRPLPSFILKQPIPPLPQLFSTFGRTSVLHIREGRTT